MPETSRTGRDDTMPRVLVLDEEVPLPANTGKRLRTLNLLSALAEEFRIELLVHANNASAERVAELDRRGIRVHVACSQVPNKSGLLLPLRIGASLAAGLPYSAYSHYQTGFQRVLAALIRDREYQLVHCEWTPYALYLNRLTMPRCLAAHNVEWLIWHRMATAEASPVHRWFFRAQAQLMRRFERQVFRQFEHVTAVSRADAEAIRALGGRNVAVVPNGVDETWYTPQPQESVHPRTLVFTGSLDWRPNQDAIAWFIRNIHPLLKMRTDYRFFVVGRSAPSWMTDPGMVPPEITVTGTVEDVRPWVAKAAVYVVPLRIGGGSRLKILEALAMQRPVVSTSIGMEGLDLTPGTHLLVADGPDAFADAICCLLRDEQRRAELSRAGRDRICATYRWKQIAPVQAELWRCAIAGPRPD